jgi:ribosomal protein L12E/L44/L45/RPP1/RPP2
MMSPALVNAALFQLTWFAAVLGGTAAAFVAAALLLLHAARHGSAKADLTIAAITAALGVGLDTAWIYLGVLDYGGAVVAPAWIAVLWAAVGVSLNHSLAMLQRYPLAGAAAAAVAAPLSYSAGAALGGVEVLDRLALVGVAVSWFAVFAPLLGWIVPRVNQLWSEQHAARH